MKTEAKVLNYITDRVCCNSNDSLIKITFVKCVLGESYSAKCSGCGNTIEGYRNVKNILVATNPILTPFLLNKANQN
jgi:hypothetical protein